MSPRKMTIQKQTRRFLLFIGGCSALVLSSCEALNPTNICVEKTIVEYYKEAPIEPSLELHLDTSFLQFDSIGIESGEVTAHAFEDFANTISLINSPEDSKEITQILEGLNSSITANTESFWSSQDPNSIKLGIENANTSLTNQIDVMLSLFMNSPILNIYVPIQLSPVETQYNRLNQSFNFQSNSSHSQRLNRSNELNSTAITCLVTWQSWEDSVLTAYDNIFEEYSAILNEDFNKKEDALLSIKGSSQIQYDLRMNYFIELSREATANIEEALAAGKITLETFRTLSLFSNIVLSFNLNASHDVFLMEKNLLTALKEAELNQLKYVYELLSKELAGTINSLKEDVSQFANSQSTTDECPPGTTKKIETVVCE